MKRRLTASLKSRSSLEILDEDGELERKADMFTKRTIRQKTVITHVDTSSEALAVSLGEKARVDLDYMSELTGFDRERLLSDLYGVVFLNIGSADSQESTYVTADEYLSGNVREKLRLAEAAAGLTSSLQINMDALRAVQPKDLEAGEIAVRLGATWIAPEYIQQFMEITTDSRICRGNWLLPAPMRSDYSALHRTRKTAMLPTNKPDAILTKYRPRQRSQQTSRRLGLNEGRKPFAGY